MDNIASETIEQSSSSFDNNATINGVKMERRNQYYLSDEFKQRMISTREIAKSNSDWAKKLFTDRITLDKYIRIHGLEPLPRYYNFAFYKTHTREEVKKSTSAISSIEPSFTSSAIVSSSFLSNLPSANSNEWGTGELTGQEPRKLPQPFGVWKIGTNYNLDKSLRATPNVPYNPMNNTPYPRR